MYSPVQWPAHDLSKLRVPDIEHQAGATNVLWLDLVILRVFLAWVGNVHGRALSQRDAIDSQYSLVLHESFRSSPDRSSIPKCQARSLSLPLTGQTLSQPKGNSVSKLRCTALALETLH